MHSHKVHNAEAYIFLRVNNEEQNDRIVQNDRFTKCLIHGGNLYILK
jgi:hypothetical protein